MQKEKRGRRMRTLEYGRSITRSFHGKCDPEEDNLSFLLIKKRTESPVKVHLATITMGQTWKETMTQSRRMNWKFGCSQAHLLLRKEFRLYQINASPLGTYLRRYTWPCATVCANRALWPRLRSKGPGVRIAVPLSCMFMEAQMVLLLSLHLGWIFLHH